MENELKYNGEVIRKYCWGDSMKFVGLWIFLISLNLFAEQIKSVDEKISNEMFHQIKIEYMKQTKQLVKIAWDMGMGLIPPLCY